MNSHRAARVHDLAAGRFVSALLFAMALMMGIGGLMVTAQVAPMAGTFKIGATALTIALTLNPIANGAGRVFWGWVSDLAGRERTMFVAVA